jgi:deoxycytidylate deaminase
MKIPFEKITEISYALLGRNPNPQFKHFSFILDRGRIISIGINLQKKTHPIAKKYNQFSSAIHSELSAALKLGDVDFSDYVLVNTRINRENKLASSYPCEGCAKMIMEQFNFEEVWATDNNGQFVRWPVI